jgi:purine catabolism regulator
MNAQASSLKELSRLAFSEPFTWLSPEPGRDYLINWISVSLNEACAGDVMLLPADQASSKILRQAQKKEVSAVLMLGEKPSTDIVLPANLPVASVSGEHDLKQTQRLLLTILINQRAALHERSGRIHAQLSQLEAEGQGLEGLVKVMADISGKGILVQDKRGRILVECASSALATIWDDIVRQLGPLKSLPESLLDRKRAGSQPTIITQDIPGGLARLVMPITVGEVARGYLSLIGVAGELDVLDHLVAEQGVRVCAVEMSRAKAVREAEKRLKGDLLTVLLQENLSPRDSQLWAQAVGLDLSQEHVGLRFAWDNPSPPSRRRLETIVNGEISRLELKAIVSPMGVEIVCFCEVDPGTSRPDLALEFGQAVVDQGYREYQETPIRCGIGNPAADLPSWRDSFSQAGQALEMAHRFHERKFLYFPDLSVYRLLFQFEHNPELSAFQEEVLGPLLAYEGGLELLQTLEVYFEHNGSLTQAAEALFIHRNTLSYRLERIAEIAGLNLDKPESRLAVELALHIYRIRGGSRLTPR